MDCALGFVLVISFAVLGGVGIKVLHSAPPIPSQVVTTDGHVLFDGTTFRTGRESGSRSAGRRSGPFGGTAPTSRPTGRATGCIASASSFSIAGHEESGAANYAALGIEQQAALRRGCRDDAAQHLRCGDGQITLDPVRAAAFDELHAHYADVFTRGRERIRDPARTP